MITAEDTSVGNSIETKFCVPFEKLPKHPMNEEVSGMMIQLLMSHNAPVSIPEKEKPFLYKVIESRAKASFSFKLEDPKLIIFLCVLTQSPGTAVMYLTYMQYWAKKRGIKNIDFNLFCSEIFPMGFPSEDDLHTLWRSQKIERREGGSDNLLDYQSAMSSIQFENV